MELFEEALQKWEQALSVGQRGDGLRNPETASEAPSEVGSPPPGLSYPRPPRRLVVWLVGGHAWEASSSAAFCQPITSSWVGVSP